MKKWLALLLVCVLCLGMCACGTDTSVDQTPTAPVVHEQTATSEQSNTIAITADNIQDYFGFELSCDVEKNKNFNTSKCSVTIESYLKSSAQLHNVEVIYKVGYVDATAVKTAYSDEPLNANYQDIFNNATDSERSMNFDLQRDVVAIPASGNLSKTYTWSGSDKHSCPETHLVYTIVDARGEITLL